MSLSPTQCSLKRQKSFMSKCKWLIHVYFWRSIFGILKRPLVLRRLDRIWKIVSKWPCWSRTLWHFQSSFLGTISSLCISMKLLKPSPSGIQWKDYFYTCKSNMLSEINWLARNSITLQLPKPKNIFTCFSQIASHCKDEQMHLLCLDIQNSSDIYL